MSNGLVIGLSASLLHFTITESSMIMVGLTVGMILAGLLANIGSKEK